MARTLVAVLIGTALLVGCQQQSGVADRLPPMRNLDGPRSWPEPLPPMAMEPAQPPAPVPVKPRPPAIEYPAEWKPLAPANAWRWIVIHHSATAFGNADQFDRSHRQKGWDELAYHFVIGNGLGSGDGQVEVGSRWMKQKWGAHTKTPDNQFNDFGIGICLVGDFEVERPSQKQVESLTKLLAYLMKTYQVPSDHVIGHCDARPTHCPGAHVNLAEIRQRASAIVRAGYTEPSMSARSAADTLRGGSSSGDSPLLSSSAGH